MNLLKRAASMTAESLHGASMKELAEKHGISIARAQQIVTKTLNRVGQSSARRARHHPKWIIMVRLGRWTHPSPNRYDENTPEGYYHFVERERAGFP